MLFLQPMPRAGFDTRYTESAIKMVVNMVKMAEWL
jgi:hypothetical protein